jgi:hypothetical protein
MDSLAQNTDPGELTGFPIAQARICLTSGEEKWVPLSILDGFIKNGATLCETNTYRTEYAIPPKINNMWRTYMDYLDKLAKYEAAEAEKKAQEAEKKKDSKGKKVDDTETVVTKEAVVTEETTNKTESVSKPVEPSFIYLIDDAFRANALIMQAVMDLLESQTCGSWKLPPNTTIVLTNNPDDGNYSVSSTDGAQNDRSITIDMKWDHNDWAENAEGKTDSRCINFTLTHNDAFTVNVDKSGLLPENYVSPRMLDKFFSLISNIEDFSSQEGMLSINEFGEATIGKVLTKEFIRFVTEKGDRLPSPEQLLKKFTEKELSDFCAKEIGNPTNPASYKKATSSVVIQRMRNYLVNDQSNYDKKEVTAMADRIKFILNNPLFAQDQMNALVSSISKGHQNNKNLRNIISYIATDKAYQNLLVHQVLSY